MAQEGEIFWMYIVVDNVLIIPPTFVVPNISVDHYTAQIQGRVGVLGDHNLIRLHTSWSSAISEGGQVYHFPAHSSTVG